MILKSTFIMLSASKPSTRDTAVGTVHKRMRFSLSYHTACGAGIVSGNVTSLHHSVSILYNIIDDKLTPYQSTVGSIETMYLGGKH